MKKVLGVSGHGSSDGNAFVVVAYDDGTTSRIENANLKLADVAAITKTPGDVFKILGVPDPRVAA